jgi:hypothetical protein
MYSPLWTSSKLQSERPRRTSEIKAFSHSSLCAPASLRYRGMPDKCRAGEWSGRSASAIPPCSCPIFFPKAGKMERRSAVPMSGLIGADSFWPGNIGHEQLHAPIDRLLGARATVPRFATGAARGDLCDGRSGSDHLLQRGSGRALGTAPRAGEKRILRFLEAFGARWQAIAARSVPDGASAEERPAEQRHGGYRRTRGR